MIPEKGVGRRVLVEGPPPHGDGEDRRGAEFVVSTVPVRTVDRERLAYLLRSQEVEPDPIKYSFRDSIKLPLARELRRAGSYKLEGPIWLQAEVGGAPLSIFSALLEGVIEDLDSAIGRDHTASLGPV